MVKVADTLWIIWTNNQSSARTKDGTHFSNVPFSFDQFHSGMSCALIILRCSSGSIKPFSARELSPPPWNVSYTRCKIWIDTFICASGEKSFHETEQTERCYSPSCLLYSFAKNSIALSTSSSGISCRSTISSRYSSASGPSEWLYFLKTYTALVTVLRER